MGGGYNGNKPLETIKMGRMLEDRELIKHGVCMYLNIVVSYGQKERSVAPSSGEGKIRFKLNLAVLLSCSIYPMTFATSKQYFTPLHCS